MEAKDIHRAKIRVFLFSQGTNDTGTVIVGKTFSKQQPNRRWTTTRKDHMKQKHCVSMQLVALISGGKDSLYSICKCIAYGHQVVALANLFPQDSTVQDADSYMYQTVGHQIIGAYAKALQLPLFRRPTKGKAVSTTLGYSRQPWDEVEDLYQLLLQVKQQMPQVQGVCSGAILSDYQRNRVEHVCSRLELISFAYLWRRNQKQLLEEMLETGIDAIIVKVATMGLYPRKHLGRHLVEVAPVLMDLESKYGSHVCGEGGEFESLVLDCPLFCYRLVIDESEQVVVSDDRFAPIGYLRIQKYHLEEKSLHVNRIEWMKSLVSIKSIPCGTSKEREATDNHLTQFRAPLLYQCRSRWSVSKPKHISYFLCCDNSNDGKDIVEKMKKVLEELEESLKECSLSRKNIFYCHLYLSDMNQFALVNQVYASYFGVEEPPCRICLQLSSSHSSIVLEAFAWNVLRRVLHVQSISEWAPPCIGPYSQACFFQHVVFISGILALHPPTVTIIPGLDIEQETNICIENVNHTLEALPCRPQDIVFIYCYITRPQDAQRVDSLLYNTYGKQCGWCILPVANLPRNGSVELQLICSISPSTDGSLSGEDSRPWSVGKQVFRGEFSTSQGTTEDTTLNNAFQVTWQLCTAGSILVLHATWKQSSQVRQLEWYRKQMTAILHPLISHLEMQLDAVGAHISWVPLVARMWLPKQLFHCNDDNCYLQDIMEQVIVQVLTNEYSINRTPVFIVPLEDPVGTCHLQLMLQLEEKVTNSRL